MLPDIMIREQPHAFPAGAASLPVLAEANFFIYKHL
jgi:hypothetical protein